VQILRTKMGGFLSRQPLPPPQPTYSNFHKLKQICESETEPFEIKKHTCALVKKIETDFHQPTRWVPRKGNNMLFFETTIEGPNYMGGEDPDYLWGNESELLDKWNMDIVSHSVQNNQAGGGYSDYGGGPGVAWESDTHRFFFRLSNDFFNGSLEYHGYPYSPTLVKSKQEPKQETRD
jgi:hypothetical protein